MEKSTYAKAQPGQRAAARRVRQYAEKFPHAGKDDIAYALGIRRKNVDKYWKWVESGEVPRPGFNGR